MENTSDYFILRPFLFCLKSERSVCYSVPDNTFSLKNYLSNNILLAKLFLYSEGDRPVTDL